MKTSNKWYLRSGDDGDVVISTRVRLARNLSDFPFPGRMSEAQREQCLNRIRDVILNGPPAISGDFSSVKLSDLPDYKISSLMELHLISPEFAKMPGGELLINKDESISVMLFEEDHIRIQVLAAGMDLKGALSAADKLDSLLDEKLTFAFDEKLGYLTSCPTNLGTGMRASVMLHLPALTEKGAVAPLANMVSKLGLTIRGMYGEASEPKGSIYQLSNQVTLGISETAAVENLAGIAGQVIAEERSLREGMRGDIRAVDRIWRSAGLLQTARLLTNEEFMKLISNVRLGVSMGIIENVKMDTVSELLVSTGVGMMSGEAGEMLSPLDRDLKRASLCREKLTY